MREATIQPLYSILKGRSIKYTRDKNKGLKRGYIEF
nr:MAG TPA: hypothetical protein [Caudoviricetes sp.]